MAPAMDRARVGVVTAMGRTMFGVAHATDRARVGVVTGGDSLFIFSLCLPGCVNVGHTRLHVHTYPRTYSRSPTPHYNAS